MSRSDTQRLNISVNAAFDAPWPPSSGPGLSPIPGDPGLEAGPGEGAVRARSRNSWEREKLMDWVRDGEVSQPESDEDGFR